MDDPHAVPFLKKAIASERIAELRDDIRQALDQLEKKNP
jgi:hypothetical protein